VFYKLFEDHLRACSNPAMKWTTLYVQLKEKSRPGSERNWAVCLSNSPNANARRNAVKAKIRSIGESLRADARPANFSRSATIARTSLPLVGPSRDKKRTQPTTPDSSPQQRTPLAREQEQQDNAAGTKRQRSRPHLIQVHNRGHHLRGSRNKKTTQQGQKHTAAAGNTSHYNTADQELERQGFTTP
jgi:hypothetical protein